MYIITYQLNTKYFAYFLLIFPSFSLDVYSFPSFSQKTLSHRGVFHNYLVIHWIDFRILVTKYFESSFIPENPKINYMKYMIFTGLIVLYCTSIFAQTITTKSGLKVKTDYSYIMTDRLRYPTVLENNKNYILYSEIDTITGYIDPSLKKDILKKNNSVVFVIDQSSKTNRPIEKQQAKITLKDGRIIDCTIEKVSDKTITYSNPTEGRGNVISKEFISEIITSNGEPLRKTNIDDPIYMTNSDKSSTFETAGDYISSAGGYYLSGVGLSIGGGVVGYIGASNEDLEALMIVGAGMAITGFVCTIIGHTKLIKAGKKLNERRSLSLQPSKSGIGLALAF